MKATSNNSQLSLFDFTPPPVVTAPVEYDVPARLQEYWSNSMDLAFSLINKLFDELFKEDREKLMEFVEYVKACRLAETSEAPRPLADRLFDAYAESLGSLHFTRIDREGTEVVRTETTVLDFLVDVSFDEEELDNLLAWKMGTPSSKVDELYLVIITHGMQAVQLTLNDLVEKEKAIAKSNDHPYVIMLKRLGISEDIIPDPSDKDAVLKAMLDGIGASTRQVRTRSLRTRTSRRRSCSLLVVLLKENDSTGCLPGNWDTNWRVSPGRRSGIAMQVSGEMRSF